MYIPAVLLHPRVEVIEHYRQGAQEFEAGLVGLAQRLGCSQAVGENGGAARTVVLHFFVKVQKVDELSAWGCVLVIIFDKP
jgi:hypothetical protein